MKRFAVFDPPEYLDWKPDPGVIEEFTQIISEHPERKAVVDGLSHTAKLDLYAGMLRTRLHDIMLKRWVKQGVISKAWLGTGEEATTVGPVHALDRTRDFTVPMIRNAGACCEMGMSVADMLRGYLGTADSPSMGRDGHVGSFGNRVLQPISHIGNMPPVTSGIGLYFRMRGEDAVVLTWIGDGSVNSGPTHEALNFAAVQQLPVIFIIQNNQVALGTRVEAHRLPSDFSELHEAYGVSGWSLDGNNVLDAYAATKLAVQQCRAGEGPVILAAETFRMGGHATHDETEARAVLPQELFEYWGKRDPIGMYEEYLTSWDVSKAELERVEAGATTEVDEAAAEALASRETATPRPETAVERIFAG